MESRTLSRVEKLLVALLGLLIAGAYILLHQKFRPENVDDAWFLSFAYNFLKYGIDSDISFGGGLSSNCIRYFGEIFAYTYGFFLDFFGWTKSNAIIFSNIFCLASAGLWFVSLRRLNFSFRLSLFFALLSTVIVPFYSSASQARPDVLVYFLMSLGFFFAVRGFYFLAALLPALAAEIHPIAVFTLSYSIALLIVRRHQLQTKDWVSYLAGILTGAAFYLLLHGEHLQSLIPMLGAETNSTVSFLWSFFFIPSSYRHTAELGFILVALLIFIRKKLWKTAPVVLSLIICIFLMSWLFRRDNLNYGIFAYPAFLLLVLFSFEQSKKLALAVLIYFLYLTPFYGVKFWKNRDYSFEDFISKVEQVVPNDDLPVLANPSSWFAFQDRKFYSWQGVGSGHNEINASQYYFLESDIMVDEKRYPLMQERLETITKNYTKEFIGSFEANRTEYRLYRMTRPETQSQL